MGNSTKQQHMIKPLVFSTRTQNGRIRVPADVECETGAKQNKQRVARARAHKTNVLACVCVNLCGHSRSCIPWMRGGREQNNWARARRNNMSGLVFVQFFVGIRIHAIVECRTGAKQKRARARNTKESPGLCLCQFVPAFACAYVGCETGAEKKGRARAQTTHII